MKGTWKRTTFKAHESEHFIDFLYHEVRKKSVVKRTNEDGDVVGRAGPLFAMFLKYLILSFFVFFT